MALDSDVIINGTNFRWPIKIVQPNLTRDSFGGTRSDDATVFAEVWAAVEALSATTFGRTVYAAQQEVSEVTHRVTIRYLDGIKSSMNVWHRDRQFQIQAIVDPDEQQKVLFLLCIERNDSAIETPAS
jgi:SPP1 family predicted phage head-tail adaptor